MPVNRLIEPVPLYLVTYRSMYFVTPGMNIPDEFRSPG